MTKPFAKKIKRHFQLLEVIVAAFIILVCAAPALKVFTTIYIEQQEIVRENQRDHIARLVHADVVEQLYKRTISLDDLKQEEERQISNSKLEALLKKWSYEGTYAFSNLVSYTKRGDEKPIKYLVKLIITMKDTSRRAAKNNSTPPLQYDYEVYIDAGALSKNNKKQTLNEDDTNDEDQMLEDSDGMYDGNLGPDQLEDNKPVNPFKQEEVKSNANRTGDTR